MDHAITQCPACGDGLAPVKMHCLSCGLALEGRFTRGPLAGLSREQLRFVEAFLVARGSIKEVEKELGISYPTVRKRLEEVVDALGYPSREGRQSQGEILDAVDRGELAPQEAIERLRRVR